MDNTSSSATNHFSTAPSGFPQATAPQQSQSFNMGVSKDAALKTKIKSTSEVAEARLEEAYGTIGESTNIKRQREDYAI
jgi:hypothetical protein